MKAAVINGSPKGKRSNPLRLTAAFRRNRYVSILGTAFGSWVGAINSVLPALMGVFTAWFQKWYPAKAARG